MKKISALILASSNPGKVAEFQRILAPLNITVASISQLPEFRESGDIEETGITLQENALIKARQLHRKTGKPTLADDTGLEVYALNLRPGVHTARFAGPDADSAANIDKLLQELENSNDRSARFRTVLTYIDEQGSAHYFEGICEGHIAISPGGTSGFGYDPVFIPASHDRTFAEMTADQKNKISHRARAIEKFIAFLS